MPSPGQDIRLRMIVPPPLPNGDVMLSATANLNNNDVIQLPTVSFILLAGKPLVEYVLHTAFFEGNFAQAYSHSAVSHTPFLWVLDNDSDFKSTVIPFTSFLSNTGVWKAIVSTYSERDSDTLHIYGTGFHTDTSMGRPLVLRADVDVESLSNFGGGDPSNTLKVTVFYSEISVSA